jgi:hypothetical protein
MYMRACLLLSAAGHQLNWLFGRMQQMLRCAFPLVYFVHPEAAGWWVKRS